MPRIAREKSVSCFYHVMVQGINKEYISDKELYMKKYKQLVIQKLKVKLLAYCIMNNHVHMLVYAEDSMNLGKYMQKLNTSYSMFYNKVKNRVGHVFRNRYNSQSILNQSHLYNCLVYIHNNPVRAGIVNRPDEYKYSSYNDFIKNNGIIDNDVKKLLFGSNYNYIDLFKTLHNLKDEGNFIDICSDDNVSKIY